MLTVVGASRERARPAFRLADALLPHRCLHRAFAVLRAYFDESGIHAGSKTTVVSGFVGSRSQWRWIARRWQKTMKGRVFHYTEMGNQTELLEKLANILDESDLGAVLGGFLGDWDRTINSGAPDWPKRFPSCYQMILEMCVHRMEEHSNVLWKGEPIVLTFSRQDQYAPFAEKLWRAHKATGLWSHIVDFGYGDPELPELQAADMLVHEAFQCARQVYERGETASPRLWEKKWPLVRKLVASKKLMLANMMNEERLVEMLRKEDENRRYLKRTDAKKS
jgi:hypothetical protein